MEKSGWIQDKSSDNAKWTEFEVGGRGKRERSGGGMSNSDIHWDGKY